MGTINILLMQIFEIITFNTNDQTAIIYWFYVKIIVRHRYCDRYLSIIKYRLKIRIWFFNKLIQHQVVHPNQPQLTFCCFHLLCPHIVLYSQIYNWTPNIRNPPHCAALCQFRVAYIYIYLVISIDVWRLASQINT